MFENWTRKLSVVVVVVWSFAIVYRVAVLREAVGLSDIATSAALILATVGGKSALSAYIAGHNGKPNGGQ